MTDYPLTRPGYAIAAGVLDAAARVAAEQVEGVVVADRWHGRRHQVAVDVGESSVSASLDLTVRYGVALPQAAEDARVAVGEALGRLTGLSVASVDVVVAAVV